MGSAYGGLSDAVAPPENILAALVFCLQAATALRKVIARKINQTQGLRQ